MPVRAVSWLLVAGLLLGAPVPGLAADRLADAALAEVAGALVTASDVALARALGAAGLSPSAAPIGRVDVQRVVAARLAVAEARRLVITVERETVEVTWERTAGQMGGAGALDAWLRRTGIAPEWARQVLAADLVRERFVEFRFRALVFIGEDEIDAELGPGDHSAEARRRVRERLAAAETDRQLDAWLDEATARAGVRYLLPPGATVPCPLPMPPRSP